MTQTHKPDCIWGQSDCEYKDTHHYCPHPEHKSTECNCFDTEKQNVVANIEDSTRAIDHTPIHYIRVVKTIKAGTLLRWDTAEKTIEKAE